MNPTVSSCNFNSSNWQPLSLSAEISGVNRETIEDAKQFDCLGDEFKAQGKFSEAFEQYEKGLEIYERFKANSLLVTDSYDNMGSVLQLQGDLSSAIFCYWRSKEIKEHLAPGSLSITNTYINLGLVYESLGCPSEASMWNQKGFEIKKNLFPEVLSLSLSAGISSNDGKAIEMAKQFDHLGDEFKAQGKFSEAFAQYEKAIAIFDLLEPGSLFVSDCYNKMGIVRTAQWNDFDALFFYWKSMKIKERLVPHSEALAVTYNNIGEVFKSLGFPPSDALIWYQKGTKIVENLAPESLNASHFYINLGAFYIDQGKVPEALRLFQRSYSIRQKLAPESFEMVHICDIIGRIYQEQGKLSVAKGLFKRCFKLLEQVKFPNTHNLRVLKKQVYEGKYMARL